ncbi:MAG: filamentous hemagglutinin N-terminal domain-containing protein, partial [Candidatus Omnitrophica bacterium]|nr:filamentous hemagglutinin N-terminal domain-containing protein [Candidatus Omnitrophota bacterium]
MKIRNKLIKKHLRTSSVIVLFCLFFLPQSIYALPENPETVHGDVSFDYSNPNYNLVVNSAGNSIINWNSYNIAGSEAVYYNQPGLTSLNRITGGNPSEILGYLGSNGRIYLVNPNGIFFGANSVVDVTGLIASTLNMSNEDFLAGRYTFYGSGGSVVNQGYISVPGGYVALLGSSVENTGVIEANLGSVVLASGEAITLNLDPQGLISVVIDEATTQNLEYKEDAVKNAGEISAEGGKVILTAEALDGVFDRAINNEGIIEAKSLVDNKGVVELKAEGKIVNVGTVDVSAEEQGADGGTVEVVSGTFINNGLISANAHNYAVAGDINIIADELLQLQDESIIEARGKDVESLGGEVYLYSYGDVYAEGGQRIDISGGSLSGDGGLGELSAACDAYIGGTILGDAALGYAGGKFVFDPTNVIINSDVTVTSDTTWWALNDVRIRANVTGNSGANLYFLADHASGTFGDWHNGTGDIEHTDGIITANGGGNITLAGSTVDLGATDAVISDSGTIDVIAYNDFGGSAYIEVRGPIESDSGRISLTSTTTGDSDFSDDFYSYIEVYSPITSNTGDIDLLATNTVTNTENLDDGDDFYNGSENYARIGVYDTEITSGEGAVNLEADNTVTNTVTSSGSIDDYEDESENYAEIYIEGDGTISTTGNIGISAINSVTRDITADSIDDEFNDLSYNYAEIDIYDTLDTTSGEGDSEGIITILADNSVTNTVDAGEYLYGYYDYSQNYADVYIAEDDTISTDLGDVAITATNDFSRDITADFIEEFEDESTNYSQISIDGTISTDIGDINMIADDYVIGGDTIISEIGDITLANDSVGRSIVLGYTTEDDDMEIDDDEIERIITGGLITIGSDTAGAIVVDTADFGGSVVSLISGETINDVDNAVSHIVAQTLALRAAATIGESDNALNTQVNTLSLEAEGDVYLDETDDLIVDTLTTEGNIELTIGGSLTDLEGADAIIADGLTLNAATGIGTSENALNTQVSTLNAETTGAGAGIYIEEEDDLLVDTITAGTELDRGDVEL